MGIWYNYQLVTYMISFAQIGPAALFLVVMLAIVISAIGYGITSTYTQKIAQEQSVQEAPAPTYSVLPYQALRISAPKQSIFAPEPSPR